MLATSQTNYGNVFDFVCVSFQVVAGAQAVVEAVDVCTRLTAGSLRHSLLPWLRFCFEVFGSTLERQLSATVGKETESVRAETATLVPSLLHTIMLAHFRKQTMHVSFKVKYIYVSTKYMYTCMSEQFECSIKS